MAIGDIIVTRAKTFNSFSIQVASGGRWSHVGMEVENHQILEVVPSTDNGKSCVRVVDKEVFLARASCARVYIRPTPLTKNQIESLRTFIESHKGKTEYTKVHAGLSANVFSHWLLFGVIYPVIAILIEPSFWETSLIAGQIAALYMIFASRIKWFEAQVEFLFLKNRYLKKLVIEKKKMFCSKLVLDADKAIGGPLSAKIKHKDEVKPVNIARACKNLGWEWKTTEI